jgi:hypothetical protein
MRTVLVAVCWAIAGFGMAASPVLAKTVKECQADGGPTRTFLSQREFRNTTTSTNAAVIRRRPSKRRPSPSLRPQQPRLPRSSLRLSRSWLRSRPAIPRPRPVPPSPKSPRPQAACRHEMNSTASWRTSSIVPPTKATRNWCRARHRPRRTRLSHASLGIRARSSTRSDVDFERRHVSYADF